MIVDANNRMIGHAPHVRSIGPHGHEWVARGGDAFGAYQECGLCGARRYTGPDATLAGRKDWLAGLADWGSPAELPIASPADVERALAEDRAKMLESTPEHRAAMPLAAIANDPLTNPAQQEAEKRQGEEEQARRERAEKQAGERAEREAVERQAAADEGRGRGRK